MIDTGCVDVFLGLDVGKAFDKPPATWAARSPTCPALSMRQIADLKITVGSDDDLAGEAVGATILDPQQAHGHPADRSRSARHTMTGAKNTRPPQPWQTEGAVFTGRPSTAPAKRQAARRPPLPRHRRPRALSERS